MSAKLQDKTSHFISPRSQILAVARLLDLIDAQSARAMVDEARSKPELSEETQREALREMVVTGLLSVDDLRVIEEFAGNLHTDLSWLANEAETDHFVDDTNSTSTVVAVPAQSDERDPVQKRESGQSSRNGSSRGSSGSSRGRSSRRRKHKRDPLYDWDRPTIGTKVTNSIRSAPRSITSLAKYWFESIQDWIFAHKAASGVIVGGILAVIIGMGAWSYYGNSEVPVKLIVSGEKPAQEEPPPPVDRLLEVKQLVADRDFDTALEALANVKKSDSEAGRDSSDLQWLDSALLIAQGGDIDWEQGGQTSWNEAGRLLLTEPDVESTVWREQFATWLLYGTDEDREQAMQMVVIDAPMKRSINYKLQAWMEARNKETDKALRFLREYEVTDCEIGDLLFRAVANMYAANHADAHADFSALATRLNSDSEMSLHQELCFPELRKFCDRLASRIPPVETTGSESADQLKVEVE